MPQHRLSRNMQLKLRGREYVIEKRLPDGTIRIRDIVTDERSAMPEQEIVEAVFGNSARGQVDARDFRTSDQKGRNRNRGRQTSVNLYRLQMAALLSRIREGR